MAKNINRKNRREINKAYNDYKQHLKKGDNVDRPKKGSMGKANRNLYSRMAAEDAYWE